MSPSSPSLRWFFPHHLGCVLVLAKADKYRLSKAIVTCPFGKFHLADELRLHPMARLHLRLGDPLPPARRARLRQIFERAVLARKPGEPRMQAAQQGVIKTCPHLSDAAKFPVVINAHDQRTEIFPTALGIRVTADH